MRKPSESIWQMRWQSIVDLLSRYKEIWTFHWQRRLQNTAFDYSADEAEFLPGSLAIQERPTSPLPHMAMRGLVLFALLALLWSIFGKLEIVVTGQGQFVSGLRSKAIQPLELSTVRAIHVKDGDHVKQGDVLVELDATTSSADSRRLQAELHESLVQFMTNESLHVSLSNAKAVFDDKRMSEQLASPSSSDGFVIPEVWVTEARHLFQQRWTDYTVQEKKHQLEIERRGAEISSLQKNIHKLQQVLPLSLQRAQDLKWLFEQGSVSRHQLFEREQVAIETQSELEAQQSKYRELELAQRLARQERQIYITEQRRQMVQASRENFVRAQGAKSELEKTQYRLELQTMRSPIDGVVQQLAIHTIGGVVTAAQNLMVIVPLEDVLELEVKLNNRDVGFVVPEQFVKVKVDAFPYTRHGVLQGKVIHVSQDAVPTQDNKELQYVARVHLLPLEGKQKDLPLMAGMTAAAEINTGSRRVIDYLLSPLVEYTTESMRER